MDFIRAVAAATQDRVFLEAVVVGVALDDDVLALGELIEVVVVVVRGIALARGARVAVGGGLGVQGKGGAGL